MTRDTPTPITSPMAAPAPPPKIIPIPNPASAPPIAPIIPFTMFNPSFAIEIIEEIRRDMPIPAVSPPMTPWAGFKFLLNAKYPPSAPPAKAPPMALSIVFPKLSPSLICAIIDMTVRVNPSPTRHLPASHLSRSTQASLQEENQHLPLLVDRQHLH